MRKELIFIITLIILVSACTIITETDMPCMDISGSERDECYAQLSIQAGKDLPNICAKIENPDRRDFCLVELVESKYRPYNCNMLEKSSNQDGCNLIVATYLKLPVYCGKISDTDTRDFCYGEIAANINSNMNICDKITNEEKKQACFGSIVSRS